MFAWNVWFVLLPQFCLGSHLNLCCAMIWSLLLTKKFIYHSFACVYIVVCQLSDIFSLKKEKKNMNSKISWIERWHTYSFRINNKLIFGWLLHYLLSSMLGFYVSLYSTNSLWYIPLFRRMLVINFLGVL